MVPKTKPASKPYVCKGCGRRKPRQICTACGPKAEVIRYRGASS